VCFPGEWERRPCGCIGEIDMRFGLLTPAQEIVKKKKPRYAPGLLTLNWI
jgi:hypothetical protein